MSLGNQHNHAHGPLGGLGGSFKSQKTPPLASLQKYAAGVQEQTSPRDKKKVGASGTTTPHNLQWNATADMATLSALLPMVQESGVHITNASSVKEYAYMEDKNFRFRPSMEDSKRYKK
jgi:hypothetical protein